MMRVQVILAGCLMMFLATSVTAQDNSTTASPDDHEPDYWEGEDYAEGHGGEAFFYSGVDSETDKEAANDHDDAAAHDDAHTDDADGEKAGAKEVFVYGGQHAEEPGEEDDGAQEKEDGGEHMKEDDEMHMLEDEARMTEDDEMHMKDDAEAHMKDDEVLMKDDAEVYMKDDPQVHMKGGDGMHKEDQTMQQVKKEGGDMHKVHPRLRSSGSMLEMSLGLLLLLLQLQYIFG